MGTPRPVFPQQWRRQVFRHIHDLSHPSGLQSGLWQNSSYGMGCRSRSWDEPEHAPIARHPRCTGTSGCPYRNLSMSRNGFSNVHVDIVGPLANSRGKHYLFTMVDCTTRWPEVNPVPDVFTNSCSRALLHGWVARFGIPGHFTSDWGAQFTSALWAQVAHSLGIQLHRTTAYHPQANGLVKRLHLHLKSALMVHLTGPDWADELPWVLLGIRSTPKEDLQVSSAELVYRAPLALPEAFVNAPHNPQQSLHKLLPHFRARLDLFEPPPLPRHGTCLSHVPGDLLSVEYVFVRWGSTAASLQRPYEGPYRVVQRSSSTFMLDIGSKGELFIMNRLKPMHLDPTEPVVIAQPKK
ncbi:uncharacterized protein [Narcine bancroftii]|uniref:uncharacterized protein n=1 Tax=Narcine bancroftii TaxID=1343680 RepID=UPI0038312607